MRPDHPLLRSWLQARRSSELGWVEAREAKRLQRNGAYLLEHDTSKGLRDLATDCIASGLTVTGTVGSFDLLQMESQEVFRIQYSDTSDHGKSNALLPGALDSWRPP